MASISQQTAMSQRQLKQLTFPVCCAGVDASNDVALYSGLGAGIIAVAILAAAVMLYRKNHSEYGVDAIDASALAGGFQSFNFKTARQGEKAGGRHHGGRHHGALLGFRPSERRNVSFVSFLGGSERNGGRRWSWL